MPSSYNLDSLDAKRTAAANCAEDDLRQVASAVSHDLQEPLRSVVSFCGLLQKKCEDQLDEKGQEYLQHAAKGAGRLEAMLNDLLSYTRLATDERPYESTQSHEAFEAAVERLQTDIVENGVVVNCGDLPAVYANRTELVIVFENLIGNAIKYQSHRSPEIHVSAELQGDQWQFCVADNGIGIESAYCERIFGLFKRLHPSHIFAGTGVGLAKCKRIVERQGGRIWVDSEHGVGSQFYFTLPKPTEDA